MGESHSLILLLHKTNRLHYKVYHKLKDEPVLNVSYFFAVFLLPKIETETFHSPLCVSLYGSFPDSFFALSTVFDHLCHV